MAQERWNRYRRGVASRLSFETLYTGLQLGDTAPLHSPNFPFITRLPCPGPGRPPFHPSSTTLFRADERKHEVGLQILNGYCGAPEPWTFLKLLISTAYWNGSSNDDIQQTACSANQSFQNVFLSLSSLLWWTYRPVSPVYCKSVNQKMPWLCKRISPFSVFLVKEQIAQKATPWRVWCGYYLTKELVH